MIYCHNCHRPFAEEDGEDVGGLCPDCTTEKPREYPASPGDQMERLLGKDWIKLHPEALVRRLADRLDVALTEIKILTKDVHTLSKATKVTLIMPIERYRLSRMSAKTCGLFNDDGGKKQPIFTGSYENVEPIQQLLNGAHRLGMLDAAGQMGCDIKKEG